MFAQDYQGETNDEKQEFTREYVSEVVYLQALHQPDAILWVTDAPRAEVWRHKPVRNYYGPRLSIYAKGDTRNDDPSTATTFLAEFDNTYRKVYKNTDGTFDAKTAKKADFLEWANEVGEVDPDNLKSLPDISHLQVTDKPIIKSMLAKVCPMYKGNREGSHWPSSAAWDKAEVMDFGHKLAVSISGHFNGKVVGADNLEADDIAYLAVKKFQKHEIVCVTTDRDWLQLCLFHKKTRIFDANKREFMDDGREHVIKKMFCKVLSGDKSDNIKSIKLIGKLSGIGDTKAGVLMREIPLMYPDLSLAKAYLQWCHDHTEPAMLDKNLTLINLKFIPQELQERGNKALAVAKVQDATVELTDIASEAAISMAKADGQAQRQAAKMLEGK